MSRPGPVTEPRRPTTTSNGAVRGRRPRKRLINAIAFSLLVLPNFVFVVAFGYWPVIYNAILSLYQWDMIAPTKVFVGTKNYADLIHNPEFVSSAVRTAIFLCVVLAGTIVFGLGLAVLFNQRLHGSGIVRAISFVPYVIGGAAVAVTWVFVFDPSYGLIRPLLRPLGLTAPDWTGNPSWALPGIIIVYVWRNAGFAAAILFAGLQGIPSHLYEAATLDGAGPWARFRRITVPLLSPIIYFVILTTAMSSFQAFDIIAIMTGGGPGDATSLLSWLVYQEAFLSNDAGMAGAIATIMFAILAGITFSQTYLLRRWVHYS